MTNVPERELKVNLDEILTRAQSERVVISRRGKPCAVLVGIETYDAEDLLLATSEDFWQMIRRRRAGGKSLPLAEVEERLRITSSKHAAKRRVTPRPRKSS
jgi:prevent-host-death family protein